MTDRLRVAIGAGHRHTLGEQGNAYERHMNGRKVGAILNLYRQTPAYQEWAEIKSYTPQDGAGLFPGYLNQAPKSLVIDSGWRPDVMVELHSQGVGNVNERGGFVIFPDWSPDIDRDVKELGHLFAHSLKDRTGIPVGSYFAPGVMSERQTGVGLQGYRLGVFRDTVAARSWCTRMIFEQGAHTSPADRAIMDGKLFLNAQALAFWDALGKFALAAKLPFTAPGEAVKPMEIPKGGKVGDVLAFGNASWKRVPGYDVLISPGVQVYAGFASLASNRIPAWEVSADAPIRRRVSFEQQGGPYLVISGGWMVRENEVTKVND